MDWVVEDLGRRGYEETRDYQLELVGKRQREEVPDTLILVEHPHVFTLGRKRESAQNVVAPGDVPVIEIERGGDVTYHGPGQIVAYPILLLREGERDLHRFLRNLEDAVIRTCDQFGLVADREPGKTGVWTGPPDRRKKLCSMGIACRKWVTFHGLALNVTTDLSYFHRINPCGFESDVMRSLESYVECTFDQVKAVLVEELAVALQRRSMTVPGSAPSADHSKPSISASESSR
ncbi:MAG TPA: lipoyl(octanoyl) transferase LipB [Kofleriaceae bacterium]